MDIGKKAVAPTKFVHFADPETGELLYETDKPKTEEWAIGVVMHNQGTDVYVKASMETQRNIFAGRQKKFTPELNRQNETYMLLKCCIKAQNFEYHGQQMNEAGFAAFFEDPEMVCYRDQCRAALGDYSSSTKE